MSHENTTEQALQFIANVTRPSELHGIIEWAERQNIDPADLEHIIDAAVKRREADDLSHIQQAVDARKNEIFDKPY